MFKDNSGPIRTRIDSLKQEISELRRHIRAAPPPPQHQQHRLPRITLMRGISMSTLDGSFYTTIGKVSAKLGHLELHDHLFNQFKQNRTPAGAQTLLKKICFPRALLENEVRKDEGFQEHGENKTRRYKAKAAAGSKQHQKILKNPKRCDARGNWVGDFDEAVSTFSVARTIEGVRRGRNVQTLNKAGLMFDSFLFNGQSHCALYKQRWHRLFKRAIALVNS